MELVLRPSEVEMYILETIVTVFKKAKVNSLNQMVPFIRDHSRVDSSMAKELGILLKI
jgi:hypothetical protein